MKIILKSSVGIASLQALSLLILLIVLNYIAMADFCISWVSRGFFCLFSWLFFLCLHKFLIRHQLYPLPQFPLLANLLISTCAWWGLLYYYGDGGILKFSKIASGIILSFLLVFSQRFINLLQGSKPVKYSKLYDNLP